MQDFIKRAQTRYVLRQLKLSNVVNFVVVSVLSIQLWVLEPSPIIIYWALFGYLIFTIRLWTSNRCQQIVQSPDKLPLVRGLIVLSLFLSGSVWCSAAILFVEDNQGMQFVLMNVTLAVMASGILPAAAAFTLAYLAFLLPSVGTLAIYYSLLGMYSYSVLTLLYLATLVGISLNLKRVITHSITTDLKNTELLREVREAKIRADEENLGKSNFLAGASHDLRQPLHAMGLFLISLRRKLEQQNPDPGAIKSLQRVQDSHESLTQLLNYLLDVSTLDSGLLQAQIDDISIQNTLAPLIAECQPMAERKGIELRTQIEDAIIRSCPVFMSRIIRNLLNNAIKFTDQGRVEVASLIRGDKVIVRVEDTGIGMSELELQNLFDPQYQIRKHSLQKYEGSGLGLAVVEKMVNMLNHKIRVTATPGEGTCFELEVDYVAEATPNPQTNPINGDLAFPNLAGKFALVVDDNAQARIGLEMMLKDWGAEVKLASSLEDVKTLTTEDLNRIDILICDYQLSNGETGFDVIQYLESLLPTLMPTIVISANTSPTLLSEMRNRKLHFIHKPAKPAHLGRIISQLLLHGDKSLLVQC